MSRWLDIAAQAELNSKHLPANRLEPAERGALQSQVDFLPVTAGLPVRELEKDHGNLCLSKPEISFSARDADSPKITLRPESASSYGTSPGGRPVTHAGKVVSLAAWRDLSTWEKHGPNGRHWNGSRKSWEAAE